MITAKDLVKRHGKKLKGMKILTERVGDWPGGNAVITRICKSDPNIAFYVRGTEPAEFYPDRHRNIGVFNNEIVIDAAAEILKPVIAERR